MPKRPVRSGRRGSFNGRFNTAKPRKPARRKIASAREKSCSLKIMNNEMKIKIKGIRAFIVLNNDGRKRRKRGVTKRIIGIAVREPFRVYITASWPFPSFSS